MPEVTSRFNWDGNMSLAWMPLYWGDYFKKTLHFSTFQHGCYMLLIGAYWCKGGPLSDDMPALAKICRTSCDKLARYGNPVLAEFSRIDGLLIHERIDFELLKASNRQESARANGQAGGLAKSKLTTFTSTNTEERKILKFSLGNGGGKGVEMTDGNKLALFHNWLAPLLGNDGWSIIGTAMDPANDDYSKAVALCRMTAKKHGKGWPHQWPK